MNAVQITLLVFLTIACAGLQAAPAKSVRQKININREWRFKLGDYPTAEQAAYSDAGWSGVHLPHNFSMPYFQSAQWYTGYGWYRRHVQVPAQWKGKQVAVEFEGAFREAEVYCNGQKVGFHQGGYTGFSIDITRQLHPGDNVLAVRLNNNWNARLAPRNGDHNFTGGIYRDVYLVITNPVHVAWYGTYVTTPNLTKAAGVVAIQTEITSNSPAAVSYSLTTDIIAPGGKKVSSVSSRQQIGPNQTLTVEQTTPAVPTPLLWHPRHPFRYKAVTTLRQGNTIIDRYETPFGFRWMRWTADSGFYLNGEHYYFRGTNVHQDHAGWASAVTNAAALRDVQMVKDCGMDFIRGSHYPHDPAFSEACDSLGILLWEENDFWGSSGNQQETDNWYSGAGAYPLNKEDQPYFDESVTTNLREMIRIHRNHPSIIIWSMCNEPFFTGRGTISRVREFLKELTQLTHQLEPTRPVGIGGCQRGEIDKLGDVAGYNGDGARLFINPGVPNVVTEYGSTIARRPGRYEPGWGDMEKQRDSSFPWRSGEALWCAFDYGTRAGDFGLMGMVDYFRMPKNMWYWYRNAYQHVPPPPTAREGVPAKLALTADKKTIATPNGTDDVQLMVAVLDKNGTPLSNSPDVTLQIVSGPGEFPTGTSITFSNQSDIYIREGKAAIELHTYYGGKTIIRATSPGLRSDSIVIETKGLPLYVPGRTPPVQERPYTRYTIKKPVAPTPAVNIGHQKPTRASSETQGHTANFANDKDTATYWQAGTAAGTSWWQADLENLYTVSELRLMPATGDAFTIELSKDNQTWEIIGQASGGTTGSERVRRLPTNAKITGRFLRITFPAATNSKVALTEVEIFGKPLN